MVKLEKKKLANRPMPDGQQERIVLRQRAINLAGKRQIENNETLVNKEKFLHIHLANNEHYGIPYKYLDEILRPKAITPIPLSAKIIVGVLPYRGELIAVLDLSQMLGVSQQAESERVNNSWFVIVSVKQMKLALLVNEVRGNYHYRVDELALSLNTSLDLQTDPIDGLFEGKIAIIDLNNLLANYHHILEGNR